MRWAILNLPDDLIAEGLVAFSGMASTVHLARKQTSIDTDPMVAPRSLAGIFTFNFTFARNHGFHGALERQYDLVPRTLIARVHIA
jgi:hypothetical protein